MLQLDHPDRASFSMNASLGPSGILTDSAIREADNSRDRWTVVCSEPPVST